MEIRRCMNCMNEISETGRYCPVCGADNRSIEQPDFAMKCGSILHGRYLIGRMLGKGEFDITYIGMDMILNVKVAVKEYFPVEMVTRDSGGSPQILWNMSQEARDWRERGYHIFLKEARKMVKIEDLPSIAWVRDFFLENETAYIVMDYVEGITLKQKLLKDGPISFLECLGLLRPMMESLMKAHKQGMIHRHISPDNIMIQSDGTVCLLDLGSAKDMSAIQGPETRPVVKKEFSPLEEYVGGDKSGTWTDVYALCATIYYCITGKLLPDALSRFDHEEVYFPDEWKAQLSSGQIAALESGLSVRIENRTQGVELLLKQLEDKSAAEYGEAEDSAEKKEKQGKTEGEPENQKELQKTRSLRKPASFYGKILGVVLASCLLAAAVFIRIIRHFSPADSSETVEPHDKEELRESRNTSENLPGEEDPEVKSQARPGTMEDNDTEEQEEDIQVNLDEIENSLDELNEEINKELKKSISQDNFRLN